MDNRGGMMPCPENRRDAGDFPHLLNTFQVKTCLLVFLVCPCFAKAEFPAPLTADRVAVVANFSFPYSQEIAKRYIKARGIPDNHLLVTGMPSDEAISR